MRRMIVRGLIIALLATPAVARAQGLLVNVNQDEKIRLPRPIVPPVPRPRPIPVSQYKIKQLKVEAKISGSIAKVQVSQSFVNTGSRQMQVAFVFPLPYDGAIDRLTLMVDGKEMQARLLDAKKAREIYESIVRKNQDPALLEWIGSGMFRTSVFPVPPGAERKVTLRYTQLLRRSGGLTEFLFPLSTAKYTTTPVEKIELHVSIESGTDIKNIYSPSHKIETTRPDGRHATISHTTTHQTPTSDFRLFYDVGNGKIGASVLSYRPAGLKEGFFLLLASPQIKSAIEKPAAKTVLFVVDRSGSMSGKKIEQAKGALKFVLNNLHEGDLFNIIAYDSQVESYRPELQKFSEQTRKTALGFVEGIYAGGSTNIDGALSVALGQLKDGQRPNYVIFLTDGLPTAGVTKEAGIVDNASSKNKVRARLFSFGVGYDVNSRLLDKLSRSNFGQSEYVKPNENIEQRVSQFYGKIGSPVLTDLKIKFDVEGAKTEQGPVVSRIYPNDAYDLFAGEQLVLVGRYRQSGNAKVTLSGKVGDTARSFDFPATFTETSSDASGAFIERLWAMRRVGEIIDQIDLTGSNDELVKELVALAIKHGILTPYTSFLAEEDAPLGDLAAANESARRSLGALKQADGKSGFQQRRGKAALQRSAAPRPTAGSTFRDTDGALRKVNTVRQIGGKTFYLRNRRWIDSAVNDEAEKQAVTIERFSKEYFDLVRQYGKRVTRFMATDDPLTLEIDGKVFAF